MGNLLGKNVVGGSKRKIKKQGSLTGTGDAFAEGTEKDWDQK